VDDNRVNRLLLTRALEQHGHRVQTAENGKIAMDMLRTNPFDVILLDIDMPVMNGFEVLEALLKDDDLRDLPVVMTSASDELDRVVKCIEMGAEDYLVKPLNPVLLRARVNASLEKKRLRDEQKKLFRTFATPEVADKLLKEGFSLGGKYVTASVMFADIRSFTTLSEKQDPADTIEMLNDYFALMFDAITANQGTVNQMEGDGLMAIFGAPAYHEEHRAHAVNAALEMIELIKAFNEQRKMQEMDVIQIGIGIATGKVIAGYTGTQHRATYTCVGDTVNLAARIENHTKVAGKPILIDKYTRDGLADEILVDDLGEVTFKGKNQAVNIFAIN
jgi:class 3 adenylate cyclase